MLVRLVYYSRALRDMSLQDIQDILHVARTNNDSLDICGMLSYESKWFLQALEGDRSTVNELLFEIEEDPRHDEVVIIGYEQIEQPIFSDWQMGYAANSGAVAESLQELGLEAFDPESMTLGEATQFLMELSSRCEEAFA